MNELSEMHSLVSFTERVFIESEEILQLFFGEFAFRERAVSEECRQALLG
jgi:hypothetical protein